MAAKRKTAKAKTTKRSTRAKTSAPKKSSSPKLVKSKSDRMVSGVIGGLANYFNIDSTVLRLVWIAIVAFTGFVPGVLAYIVAMLVMPEA